jgi:uncharacterized Zn-finger protein
LPRKNSSRAVKTISSGRRKQRYPCMYLDCDKDFSREIDRDRHEESLQHNPERQYQCLKCGKWYSREDALTRHMGKNHRGD